MPELTDQEWLIHMNYDSRKGREKHLRLVKRRTQKNCYWLSSAEGSRISFVIKKFKVLILQSALVLSLNFHPLFYFLQPQYQFQISTRFCTNLHLFKGFTSS